MLIMKSFSEILLESSLSRIWQHIRNDKSFGVVSAYKYNIDEEENFKRHLELLEDIRSMKHGFIEQISGYKYLSDDNNKEILVKERSFLVPNVSLSEILKLGKKYEQESIIYKDKERFDLIKVYDSSIVKQYKKDSDQVLNFNEEDLKDAWSQFIKTKGKGDKIPYSFTLKEVVPPSRLEAYQCLGTGKLAEAKIIRLF